jgi:uncharacterized protein associated with vWA-MoxR-VMAP ternary system
MAIREFSPEGSSKGSSPRTIGFIGRMPSDQDLSQFTNRKFYPKEMTLEQLKQSDAIDGLAALIWTQRQERPNELPRQIGDIARVLLDNDISVYIRLAKEDESYVRPAKEDKSRASVARQVVVDALREGKIPVANLYFEEWKRLPPPLRERQGSHFMPSVYIFDTTDSWEFIATIVCDHPAGRSPKRWPNFDDKPLADAFQEPERHAERVLLLRRAFWDCSELRLSFLPGGLSGAAVCKAYACLEAGQVGAYPHLYFAKIGRRNKIITEYDNYDSYILEYVPFHLAPRLRRDRCNLGSTHGILVGDFVEGTESLIACARGGRCGHAISNLFDRTLAGWRKQPPVHEQPLVDSPPTLASCLGDRWLREGKIEGTIESIKLSESRAKIVKRLGGLTEIPPLKDIFEKHGSTTPRCAPAHGDMHATNVLVRHGDAIIIDFENIKKDYPLTYDPASLEGGILVEGFVKDLKSKKRRKEFASKRLVKLLDPLYTLDALIHRDEVLCLRGSPVEWYFDCVNQIRLRSRPAEHQPGQYALTLALCLIRKGCNENEKLDKEHDVLRAVAFFFGQRILREIESSPLVIRRREAEDEVRNQSRNRSSKKTQ